MQNTDLVVALGTRLSQNVTGGMLASFARAAKIVMVDASPGEMDKFDGRGIDVSVRICARAADFTAALTTASSGYVSPGFRKWKSKLSEWRTALPNDIPAPAPPGVGYVDAYDLVDKLSEVIPEGEPIFVDTGGNLTWTCNGLRVKPGQRLFSAWNNTPMGYALPAAIGAAAVRKAPVTCIIGDGGLALCLGELATVAKHRLPIRIVLMNNHCHGIQRQTLETWLEARYVGVDEASGLAFPEFPAVARAMGLATTEVQASDQMAMQLEDAFSRNGPVFCNVEINPSQKLYPVLKFCAPLENQMPLLDPALLKSQMLVPAFESRVNATTPAGTAGV